jgi:transmembrane sensor
MSFSSPQLSDSELQAISAAARWYARLRSGSASQQEQQEWQHWLAADLLHRQAWERMQMVGEQMAGVPGRLAGPALRRAGQSRRQVLRGVLLLTSASALGWLGWRSDTAQNLMADYRTRVGERREVRLADGSSLLLNTDTSVNLRFDGQQRVLELLWGEVLVGAAPDSLQRPLRIDTRHGRVQTLAGRFLVRSEALRGQVAVLEQAVQLSLSDGSLPRRLEAGQGLDFDARSVGAVRRNDASVGAWRQGSIIAIDRPLGELLADLSRYRPGLLHCDPQIAGLKVSGAFPIDNTDRALAALESGFGLKVSRYTPYWVRVRA